MPLTKYTNAEKSEIVQPAEAKRIEAGLHKVGKTSASDLSDKERTEVFGK